MGIYVTSNQLNKTVLEVNELFKTVSQGSGTNVFEIDCSDLPYDVEYYTDYHINTNVEKLISTLELGGYVKLINLPFMIQDIQLPREDNFGCFYGFESRDMVDDNSNDFIVYCPLFSGNNDFSKPLAGFYIVPEEHTINNTTEYGLYVWFKEQEL